MTSCDSGAFNMFVAPNDNVILKSKIDKLLQGWLQFFCLNTDKFGEHLFQRPLLSDSLEVFFD